MQVTHNICACSIALFITACLGFTYSYVIIYWFLYLTIFFSVLGSIVINLEKVNSYKSTTISLLHVCLGAVQLYRSNLSKKYLFRLLYSSLVFGLVLTILRLLLVYTGLFSNLQISIIIITLIITRYLVKLIMHSSGIKQWLQNIIKLCLTLFTLYLLWFTLGLLSVMFCIGLDYLSEQFIFIVEGATSNSDSTGGEGSSTQGDGKDNKPSKPNLSIKVGPQNDAEKDGFKVGNCLHKELKGFTAATEEEVEDTLCDFTSELGPGQKPIQHKAFDYVEDKALLCDNCHAIICKNCYEETSSESDTNNSDNDNV